MKPHSTHRVDVHIDRAKAENYDALVIPGGLSNFDDLRVSKNTVAFVKAFAGKPIAAICHGTCLLIDADLVKGKTVTSYPSIAQDLRNAGDNWVDKEVVRDGNLVTSRMPDDIPAFTEKMIEVLRCIKKFDKDGV